MDLISSSCSHLITCVCSIFLILGNMQFNVIQPRNESAAFRCQLLPSLVILLHLLAQIILLFFTLNLDLPHCTTEGVLPVKPLKPDERLWSFCFQPNIAEPWSRLRQTCVVWNHFFFYVQQQAAALHLRDGAPSGRGLQGVTPTWATFRQPDDSLLLGGSLLSQRPGPRHIHPGDSDWKNRQNNPITK